MKSAVGLILTAGNTGLAKLYLPQSMTKDKCLYDVDTYLKYNSA